MTAPRCCDSIPDAVPRRQYRITRATLALFKSEDGYVAKLLPDGACIEVDPETLVARGTSLVEVIFEDNLVLMFVSDLKSLTVPEC